LYLIYGLKAWSSLKVVAHCNELITTQKSSIKTIINEPKASLSEYLFKDFTVINVQKLFQQNSLYYIFKIQIKYN